MATDPDQLFEFDGPTYDWMMERFHTLIGKLTVPATRDPLVKEVHQELIDFAFEFEQKFEEKPEE